MGYHQRYYGDKTIPPVKKITGRFNCTVMTDDQLEEYLARVRRLYIDLKKTNTK